MLNADNISQGRNGEEAVQAGKLSLPSPVVHRNVQDLNSLTGVHCHWLWWSYCHLTPLTQWGERNMMAMPGDCYTESQKELHYSV